MNGILETSVRKAPTRRFSLRLFDQQRNFTLVQLNVKSRNWVFKKWMAAHESQRIFFKKWSSNIVSSPLGNVIIPNVTLFDFVFENVKLWERKTAVECGATGRKYTYKELMSHSKALAASFQNKFKLVKGNFIVVILKNCPEYPIVLLAASLCGIVSSTINPTYTVDEMKWQMEDYDAKLIVTNHEYFEKCEAIVQALRTQIPIVVVKSSNPPGLKGGIDMFELFDQSSSGTLKPTNIEPDDPLFLPYSSGTSGGPKGVLLSYKNIISNLVQISHPEALIMSPTTRFHQDKVFGILPMFHIYGITVITLYTLREGCHLLILPRFSPALFIKSIFMKKVGYQMTKVNILYAVPAIINFLRNEAVHSKYLRNVKFVVNAASPLIIEDAVALMDKAQQIKVVQDVWFIFTSLNIISGMLTLFKTVSYSFITNNIPLMMFKDVKMNQTSGKGYGMTESSPTLTHTSVYRMQKLSSIGVPVASTKLKISSLETGEALPKGQTGELCAWGPQIMKEYFNRPKETKETVDSEGWLKTGDIAYYDDDGDFFIVDRLKDLIKSKGFQVAPAELEEVIRLHPSVKEVAVVGLSDKEFGEVPRAFVVVKEGAQVTEEDIKNIVKQKLSSYKHLKGGVKFVDELPRNNMGKILRKSLKNM